MNFTSQSYDIVENVKDIVKFLKGYIYEFPSQDADDEYQLFIVSKERLTNKQVKKCFEDTFPEHWEAFN